MAGDPLILSVTDSALCPLPFAEGLNADYVKGENLEAVVCEEPQGEDFLVTVHR